MPTETVQPKDLQNLLKSGAPVRLVDVRTPVEFREAHVRGARNVPLDALKPEALLSDCKPGETLYFICRSGSRGGMASAKMEAAAGDVRIVNVEGGTLACDAAGLDIVRGKKAISLERQVRIAAGTLVMIGTALGAFVHPYWLGLPGFVGAGLVFAGVTDTCGMGMLLAKMPWNQCGPSAACSTRTQATA